jgi:hypothetical protein
MKGTIDEKAIAPILCLIPSLRTSSLTMWSKAMDEGEAERDSPPMFWAY